MHDECTRCTHMRGDTYTSSAMSHDTEHHPAPKWKHDGVRIIPGHLLDPNTEQTPGMDRKAAINSTTLDRTRLAGPIIAAHLPRSDAHNVPRTSGRSSKLLYS